MMHAHAAITSALQAALTATVSGAGRACLLTGMSGVGKTHLARAFIEHARTRTALVGYALPTGGPPLLPICSALISSDAGEQRAQVARVAKEYAKAVPVLREVLGPLLTAHEELRYTRSVPRDVIPPETFLFYAFADILRRVARPQHAILFLDDAQWLDPSTASFLGYLLHELHTIPLLVLLTLKTNGRLPEPVEQLQATFDRFPDRASTIRIPPLEELELGHLAGTILGGPTRFTDEEIAWLHDTTRGNPRFLSEVIARLREEEQLQWADGAWIFSTPPAGLLVPTSFSELVRERTMRATVHDPDTEQAIALAAVAGREFDARLIASAQRRPVPDVVARCGRFGAATGYLERVGTSTRFRFDHDLTREALLQQLGDVRVELHRAIAAALINQAAAPAEIGYHLERAGQSREAAEMYGHAGAQALTHSACTAAAAFYLRQDALLGDLGDPPETAARILAARQHAEALLRAEEYSSAAAFLRQRLERVGDSHELLHSHGRALARIADAHAHEEAVAALTRAASISPTRAERASIWADLITVYDSVGAHDASATTFRKAVVAAREAGEDALYVRLLRLTCIFWQPEKVKETTRAGLQLARKLGLAYEEAMLRNNLGTALIHLQHLDDADKTLQRSREQLEALGGFRMDTPLNNLGIIAILRGAFETAGALLHDARRHCHDPHSAMFIDSNRAVLHAMRGDAARAREEFEALLVRSDAAGDLFYRSCIRHNYAQLLLTIGGARDAKDVLSIPVHRHAPDDELIAAKRAALVLRIHEALSEEPPPDTRALAAALDRSTKPQAWLYRLPWYICDIEFWED